MKSPAFLETFSQSIEAELKEILAERQSPLYDMMRYHLGWVDKNGAPRNGSTGKRLRPGLCLLSCEAVGGDAKTSLPVAAAIELIHNFSLIHDDIQDDDAERHHLPTVWSVWGKPQAINAGTAMRVMASLAISRLDADDISVQKQLRVQRLLDESSLILVEGQYLDINFESRFDIEVPQYMEMIEKKTAALLGCSLEVGALMGVDDESMISAFGTIGQNLGMAFQIRDDILGIWGSEEKTGKPQGSDIRHRKNSLPIVLALEKAGEELTREIMAIYRREELNEEDTTAILQILERLNVQSQAQNMAQTYCNKALAVISKLELPLATRNQLEEVAGFIVNRID